ncbi:MAG: ATP-binding protein [Candidatus Eisenbacteria bacterium]|nr:ATP-binding protein [Candidatus Eisenbacteria bacterium]
MKGSQISSPDLTRIILDSLELGHVAIDKDKKILFINKRAESILGLEVGEGVGMSFPALLNIKDDKWLSPDYELKLGEVSSRETKVKVRGKELYLRLETDPLKDSSGEPVGTVVILEDMGEGDPDDEMQRKMDRLVSLGELSAYVAHEIRNPLTGIRTTVQFVGSKLRPGDSRKEDLEDVIKELDRIEQIITDLLQFARPQDKKPALANLNTVVERVIDNLEVQLRTQKIEVARELSDNLPQLWVDPDMIQQVFLNIMINAVQAMPDGGEIKVSAGSRRGRYKRTFADITFEDSGPGVPEEIREKIFTPFFTTRPMGTGLGLAISLQLVREHDGRITVRDSSLGGALFRVSLPVTRP